MPTHAATAPRAVSSAPVVEEVAYRVVTGNLAPDHSTVAEFRCRHERPLGEVSPGVLGLCARARLVSVGLVAIDETKMAANASSDANREPPDRGVTRTGR
jgi:transposase